MNKQYVINYYDINGKHTALDEMNRPLIFQSIDTAKEYLYSQGLSDTDIEMLSINQVSDELGNDYVNSVII